MRPPLDANRFKDLAAGFQSLAFIFAVLVGGAWTAWTFYWNIQDRQKQSNREAEQQRIRERENIRLTMEVRPLRIAGSQGYARIRVDAQNSGNYPISLDFTCDPVRVMLIDYKIDDRVNYRVIQRLRPLTHSSRPTARPEPTNYPSSILRAGGQQSYSFLTRLPKTGLYWITFSAPEKVEGKPNCPEGRKAQPKLDVEPKPRRNQGIGTVKKLSWSVGSFYVANEAPARTQSSAARSANGLVTATP